VSPPPLSSEPAATVEQSRWFADEVHAHDSSLKSYLRSSFPTVRDVDDIAQESYLRIWRHRAVEPIRSAKAFLFKVAQRLALDHLRRQRRSPMDPGRDWETSFVLDEKPLAHEILGHDEKVRLLADAIDALPARCREVVVLRKLKLLSQRETAERLGISEKGVENQLARGLERCRAHLRRRGLTDLFQNGA
jgi:RNA polymerase sigma-70 factor (ECF subfamily)